MVPSYPTIVRSSKFVPLPVSLSVCYESRIETLRHYGVIENRDKTWKAYINYEIDTLYIIQSKIMPCFHCELPRGSENLRSVLIGVGYLSYKTLGGIDASNMQHIDSSLRFIQETFPRLQDLSIWTAGKARKGRGCLVPNSIKFPWYSEYFGYFRLTCCQASEHESSTEVVKAVSQRYEVLKKELDWDVELKFLGGRRVCRDILLALRQVVIIA